MTGADKREGEREGKRKELSKRGGKKEAYHRYSNQSLERELTLSLESH